MDKTLCLSSESWPFPGDSSAPVFRLVMKLTAVEEKQLQVAEPVPPQWNLV